jgi:acetolactate decarboxylase
MPKNSKTSGSPVIYQLSTSGALARGLYRGEVTIGELLEHGDLGLGTFDMLDGEMTVVDGKAWQTRSDGTTRPAAAGMKTPFAVVVKFEPQRKKAVGTVQDLETLERLIDRMTPPDNRFLAIRIDGDFEHVHTRAVPRQRKAVPLVQVAARQPEFTFENLPGVLVGFRSPAFLSNVTIAGYHMHFLDDSRTRGGHLLGCILKSAVIWLCPAGRFMLDLPGNRVFRAADLSGDVSGDLHRAERGRKQARQHD